MTQIRSENVCNHIQFKIVLRFVFKCNMIIIKLGKEKCLINNFRLRHTQLPFTHSTLYLECRKDPLIVTVLKIERRVSYAGTCLLVLFHIVGPLDIQKINQGTWSYSLYIYCI